MRYSIKPRDRIFVKGNGFLFFFAKNMGKNMGENICRNLSLIRANVLWVCFPVGGGCKITPPSTLTSV